MINKKVMSLITAYFHLNHPQRFNTSYKSFKPFIAFFNTLVINSHNIFGNITTIFNKQSNFNTGKATELTLRKLIINLWRIIL